MQKYHGELDELKSIVAKSGYRGEWSEQGEKKMFRSENGAILNWWSHTGTLNVQGKKDASANLAAVVAKLLVGDTPEVIAVTADATASPSAGTLNDDLQTNSSGNEAERVFVVYGHDASACEQLELILHKLNLFPFVLGNTSGSGLTIIEALEREIMSPADGCRFGIVLLTPDDQGYERDDDPKNAEPRARQNVVMEMGMLLAALGRQRVAILKKGHVVEPTDIGGIIYLPFNVHVKETAPRLCQRLREAGFELDPDAITAASS